MTNFALSGVVRPTLSVVTSNAGTRQPLLPRTDHGMQGNLAPGNPANLFTTSGRTIRAMDLAGLLDSIGGALRAIEAAETGISALTELVESAQDLAHRALRSRASDGETRAELAGRFDGHRGEIDRRVVASAYKTTNLLDNGVVRIALNENNTASFTVFGVKFDAVGLGIAKAANAWQSDEDIKAALGNLAAGLVTLRAQATVFGSDLSLVQTREDFTQSMIGTLESDADSLGLAEQDEEAARLVTLSMRQRFATTALSLTTQSEQSILRLF